MSQTNDAGFVRMGEFCTHLCNTALNQQDSSSNRFLENTFEVKLRRKPVPSPRCELLPEDFGLSQRCPRDTIKMVSLGV
jgi:hypothetical protein